MFQTHSKHKCLGPIKLAYCQPTLHRAKFSCRALINKAPPLGKAVAWDRSHLEQVLLLFHCLRSCRLQIVLCKVLLTKLYSSSGKL